MPVQLCCLQDLREGEKLSTFKDVSVSCPTCINNIGSISVQLYRSESDFSIICQLLRIKCFLLLRPSMSSASATSEPTPSIFYGIAEGSARCKWRNIENAKTRLGYGVLINEVMPHH